MGSYFETYNITADSWDAAAKAAANYQAQQCHERGHGAYTGHLGTISGVNYGQKLEFANAEAAETYIADKHMKWEPPLLVRVSGTNAYVFGGYCPA